MDCFLSAWALLISAKLPSRWPVRCPCLEVAVVPNGAVQLPIVQLKALAWQAHFADSLGQTQQAIECLRSAHDTSGRRIPNG